MRGVSGIKGKRRLLIRTTIVLFVLLLAKLTVPCPGCETPILLNLVEKSFVTLSTSLNVNPNQQMAATYAGFILNSVTARSPYYPTDFPDSDSFEITGESVIYHVDLSSQSVDVSDEDLIVVILRRTHVDPPGWMGCLPFDEKAEMTRSMLTLQHQEVVEEIVSSFEEGEPSHYACRPGGIGENPFDAYFQWAWGGVGMQVEACVADVDVVGSFTPPL